MSESGEYSDSETGCSGTDTDDVALQNEYQLHNEGNYYEESEVSESGSDRDSEITTNEDSVFGESERGGGLFFRYQTDREVPWRGWTEEPPTLYPPERGPPILDFLFVLTAFVAAVFAAYYTIFSALSEPS